MNFDEQIPRLGTHSMKWDEMHTLYNVPPERALPMWVADMDFRPPACVQRVIESMAAHGVYGYYGDDRAYKEAVIWWMQNRHGWEISPEHILTVHGLVNAVGLIMDAFSSEGDGVIVMSPVYNAFARVVRAAGRAYVECPLAIRAGRYEMDFEAWGHQMTGRERIMILSSPHNPAGRVWTAEELRDLARFCTQHNLLLVSDEIHHDLIMPGHQHHVMARVAPEIQNQLITLTSASKTFNIAGCHTGNMIISDAALRKKVVQKIMAFGISSNAFGPNMVQAAYSPEGAIWVDALRAYLDKNRQIFEQGIHQIPGLCAMPLEATYLSWVDFSRTGLSGDEIKTRVEHKAAICPSYGPIFGKGGENFLRFNLAMPRAHIQEAIRRLHEVFADLQ